MRRTKGRATRDHCTIPKQLGLKDEVVADEEITKRRHFRITFDAEKDGQYTQSDSETLDLRSRARAGTLHKAAFSIKNPDHLMRKA